MDNKITNTQAETNPLLALVGLGAQDDQRTKYSTFIEGMEKQGQNELTGQEGNSILIPTEMQSWYANGQEILLKSGWVLLDPVEDDPIFRRAIKPDGWEIRPTDHSMWSDICDDKGRKRASIFYKAAFYDRRACLQFNRRYSYLLDWPAKYEGVVRGIVLDGKKEIWQTAVEKLIDDHQSGYEQIHAAEEEAKQWLDKHYPNHLDPSAYWD